MQEPSNGKDNRNAQGLGAQGKEDQVGETKGRATSPLQRWVMRFRLWKCKTFGHRFLYREIVNMQGRVARLPLITYSEELTCKRCGKEFSEKNACNRILFFQAFLVAVSQICETGRKNLQKPC